MNVMEIIKQNKDLDFLQNHGKPEPLTLAAQLLKERLSQEPFYAQKAQGGNDYWNSLASSRFNA